MKVEELYELKKAMERKLAKAIEEEVCSFSALTGVPISKLEIHFLDTRTASGGPVGACIGNVEAVLEFDEYTPPPPEERNRSKQLCLDDILDAKEG